MEIEYGMTVLDKNDKPVGTIGKIFMDAWTGKPRKYMVRQDTPDAPDEFFLIPPEQFGEVSAGKVKLKLSIEELAKT